MNSYAIGISGSWWLLILTAVLATGFSIYVYRRTIPPISKLKKTILTTLRSIALIILLMILFEPVLTTLSGSIEPPVLNILMDNSLSVAQKDASGDRKDQYLDALISSGIEDISSENKIIQKFDSDILEIENFSTDSLEFGGQLTNISNALRNVISKSGSNNIRAALMFTDGAFNAGNNPIYDAEMLGMPLYIVGIGDSSEPKDIQVQSVITNEIAYIDNPVPVNVNILVHGYSSGALTVELLDNNNKISEQNITISEEKSDYSLMFEYLPKISGFHKIEARVSTLDDEITHKNNALSEYIEVLENKRRYVLFAGAPSPDVSFLMQTLKKEKGIEIKEFISKKGTEFFGSAPTPKDMQEAEIIMMIGFPVNNTPDNLLDLIAKEAEKKKSILLIASKDLDYNKLRKLEKYMPFKTVSSRVQEFLSTLDIAPEAASHPLLRYSGNETDRNLWLNLPPIFRTETFVNLKPESELVAGVKVNNVNIQQPLIATRSFQNQKTAAVIGYGLYRWKLLGYAGDIAKGMPEAHDMYTAFVNNAIRWLSVDENNKNIRITTSKKHYSNSEQAEFIAQVYDDAYTPVENAVVDLTVKGAGETREMILNSLGNGRYTAKAEGLPAGEYSFEGKVSKNGIFMGKDAGRFSVGETAAEYQNLRMNSSLLRMLAERTGGKFYTTNEAGDFAEDFKNISNFEENSITLRSEFNLWNLPWLIGIAILCFGVEWAIRKRSGLL